MIAEFLAAIGVPGQLVLVISAAVTLWHGRHALRMAALFGTWVRFAGLAGFVLVVLMSGLVPGAHLQVDISTLVSGLGDLVSGVLELLEGVRG